ncbi:MAG: hypothetical protein U0269_27515 [Polyangiales bacterium]
MHAGRYERISWAPGSHAVIADNHVLAQIWERAAPATAMQSILDWCKRRPKGTPLWMIAVVPQNSEMPDARAREIASEFPRYFSSFAMVIEGRGFRVALVRSLLTSMAIISPRRVTPLFAETVDEGSALIARASHGAVDAAALSAMIADARLQIAR